MVSVFLLAMMVALIFGAEDLYKSACHDNKLKAFTDEVISKTY